MKSASEDPSSAVVGLSGLTTELVPDVYSLIQSNREYLGRWLPWVRETSSLQRTCEFVVRAIELAEQRMALFCPVTLEKTLVAVVGATSDPKVKDAMNINYWIAEKYAGRGLATYAVRILIDHLRRDWGTRTFYVGVSDGNTASARVAQKLGFKFLKTVPHGEEINGRAHTVTVDSYETI